MNSSEQGVNNPFPNGQELINFPVLPGQQMSSSHP